MTPILPNLKHLAFGGAAAIDDPATKLMVQDFISNSAMSLGDPAIHVRFVNAYRDWIWDSRLNSLTGLGDFPILSYSNGTTESFDKFYLKNSRRRFRCFRGEYMYHAGSWKTYHDWAWMDEDELRPNDAVVLSLPFSDTGDIHPETKQTLDECARLGVPVLIDCAFFGLCSGIRFDLSHTAITDIVFSLSKTMPVPYLRIGMRLTRTDDDDSLLICNKTNYVNRIGAYVGLQCLSSVDADHNYNKWSARQSKLCADLSVTPSPTVIFGIDTNNRFPEYNRGGNTNRLCFNQHLAQP